MYPNKLITNSMSSYDFFILTFFHEILCSTCHKFILNQQDCRMSSCKNKNNSYVNIKKYVGFKIIIQTQIQTLN